MARRPSAALALMAVPAVLLLGACAPQTETAPPPTSSPTSMPRPSTPAPSPTVDTLVVAPAEKPPVVFGGDCDAAVPAAILTAATGIADIAVTARDPLWTTSIDNVGGLVCEWAGGGVSGSVQILPRHAIPEDVPQREQSHVGECGWGCSWEYRSDELWIAGYASDLPERGREEADRIGAQVGSEVNALLDPATLNWRRDETGWWAAQECATTAAALSDRLGQTVEGAPIDYHDPPMPATRMGDAASHRSFCAFTVDGQELHVSSEAGTAWSVPWGGLGEPVDLGLPGVSAFRDGRGGYLAGTTYEMTDGVNVLNVELSPGLPFSIEQIAEAFAAVMAEARA